MNKNQKNLKENNSLLDTELPLRGEALKQVTSTLATEIQTKIIKSQSGVGTFFDNGFLGLFKELSQLNQDLPWEEGVKQLRGIRGIQLRLVLPRLRHFLNQRRQERFVDFSKRFPRISHKAIRNGVNKLREYNYNKASSRFII
jgi:hypothetical protein